VGTDLNQQIHEFMERGIHRLAAPEAIGRQSAGAATFPDKSGSGRGRLGAIVAGVAALACAGALVAGQLGGPTGARRHAPPRKSQAVLTAAVLRQVATASRLALARSGRAVVRSRTLQDGVLQSTGTDIITFAGKNWNDSFSEVLPGVGGAAAMTQSAINRVVNGQAYDYFVAIDGKRWYHVTGPDAVASMNIPDPRKLLAELAPGARFVAAGKTVLDGVAVTKLVATDPSALPALDSMLWPGSTITAATVWVDRSGVVRQLSLSGTKRVHGVLAGPKFERLRALIRQLAARVQQVAASKHISYAAAGRIVSDSPLGRELKKDRIASVQLIKVTTTVTVSFTDIGKPQVIKVPAGAVRISAVG
jgi:hypothetical protein